MPPTTHGPDGLVGRDTNTILECFRSEKQLPLGRAREGMTDERDGLRPLRRWPMDPGDAHASPRYPRAQRESVAFRRQRNSTPLRAGRTGVSRPARYAREEPLAPVISPLDGRKRSSALAES